MYVTGLDSCPPGREEVAGHRILGIVVGDGASGTGGRVVASLFPAWSRLAAVRYWYRKIQEAPLFGSDATASIARKYEKQVESYAGILDEPLDPWIVAVLRRLVPHGGSILVAGSGSGREALHLAREGYRVTGFDLVPEMVEASRRNALAMGVKVEFFQADMATMELGEMRYDSVYVTPLVYSFLESRARRVESLRRLGRTLGSEGGVVYSAHVQRRVRDVARTTVAWLHRRLRGDRHSEMGDWFTWFLTPEGRIATAFSRRFFRREIFSEARAAGFRSVADLGHDHFHAEEFAP
jgi:SAM-dependent methyltransferase